ncbi:MAG: glycosyltransferase, partial [Deltaproteobacteria bacterium]|nr:glycosyltransferase [Deltaproteobacteria bacterium]
MTKIKVLHLVEDLEVGGLEKVIASIVLGLDDNRYKASVWCLSRGGQIAEELIEKGASVKILGMGNYYNPSRIITLSRLLKRERLYILHTHGYFASTFGRIAAILARVPIIITHVHSTYYGYSKRNILIERFLSVFTDKIVCVSMAVQKFVIQVEGINEKKCIVIYNGVEVQDSYETKLSVNRKSFGISDSDIIVITVASLTAHKGHSVLIDAMHILIQKYENLKLLIVGDGPLRNDLFEYVKRLDLTRNMLFAGLRKDIFALLKLSDIFVLPSLEREGLGIAIIEAMACNLPLVGTFLGGIPEVIEENGNGFLVKPGDPEELAAATERLINDKTARTKMGQMGSKIFEEKF